MKGEKRFTFAADEFSRRLCDIPKLPSTADLYKKSLNNKDTMRETLEYLRDYAASKDRRLIDAKWLFEKCSKALKEGDAK